MIHKVRSENDFYVVKLPINGKIIYASDLFTESKNKSGAIGFKTKIHTTKSKTKPIRLNVLSREVGHNPRVKVSDEKNSVDMFDFPIYRNTGLINDEKEGSFIANNPYNLKYNEVKDFVQDFSKSCITQIIQYFNNESNSETEKIIRYRLEALSECGTSEERKILIDKFMKEDGR